MTVTGTDEGGPEDGFAGAGGVLHPEENFEDDTLSWIAASTDLAVLSRADEEPHDGLAAIGYVGSAMVPCAQDSRTTAINEGLTTQALRRLGYPSRPTDHPPRAGA